MRLSIKLWIIPILLAVRLLSSFAQAQMGGVDTYNRAAVVASWDANLLAEWGRHHPWLRLNGLSDPGDREAMLKEVAALHTLRKYGFKSLITLRLAVKDWKRKYLPEDLREIYESRRKLGAAYGEAVDAWEIDNEPDLGFVPELAERYTAYLKASYLGLKAGSEEHRAKGPTVLVIMGALGLPPGPWLERFVSNDGLAYTDGYNFHYYGYANDFTGVYRQHEAAVLDLLTLNSNPSTTVTRSLPVFLTEFGFGMLGQQARDTKEGRMRQWRWFKSVGEQIADLPIQGSMAFRLTPFLEYGLYEYGLTLPAQEAAPDNPLTAETKPLSRRAGGIEYTADDFAEAGPTGHPPSAMPWMTLLGKKIGQDEITPALAWWIAARRSGTSEKHPPSTEGAAGTRPWTVTTGAPSPIVIDFLPQEGLSAIKRYNGNFVTGREPPVHRKAESEKLEAEDARPTTPDLKAQIPAAPPRSEEFIIQIRTANGNLYEVYPTRQATPVWQGYFESRDNFTLTFYGRAETPWRFRDNRPVALVVSMYPKQVPATYDFRRVLLLRLGKPTSGKTTTSTERPANAGRGTLVLYNFSPQPVTGRLLLPSPLMSVIPPAPSSAAPDPRSLELTLGPGERRTIELGVQILGDRGNRVRATIAFVPVDPALSEARFVTDFIPDIGGVSTSLVANLLSPDTRNTANQALVANRARASEEAPMTGQVPTPAGLESHASNLIFFTQSGATVGRTVDGFKITVTSLPPGKPQRSEIEIPWPDGLAFPSDAYLSMDFRIH